MTNIKTHLNNIKGALYGKDVRNSIHDAIEQCYTDASINGNANMEVTQARGEYETLGERLDDHASQLEQKANLNSVFSLANMGLDGKEAMTGGSVAVVGKNMVVEENIVDGQVTSKKTSFLDNLNKNLFDGVFLDGYIQDTGSGNRYTTALSGKTVAINVKPNTTYSINKSSLGLDGGYYYFKLISFTKTKEEVLNTMSSGWSIYKDGSIELIDATATSQRLNYTFTTGNNDKSIFVVVARTLIPYVEVFEGDFNKLQYSSYKEEDNILKNTKVYESDIIKNQNISPNFLNKNGNVINITLNNKVKYTFEKRVDDNIKLNTWLLTYGGVNDKDLWVSTDIEAPIKEKDAVDFIGGVHGDEVFESIEILVDGKILDLNNNYRNLNFNNLTIFVKSTLNHCDTSTPAFTRYKKLEFVDKELIVSNRLICLSDFIVERYTGCGLYSVYKDELVGYSTNTINTLVKSGGQALNKNMDIGYFYGNDFTITVKTISGKTENFGGFVQDFYNEDRPRYKFYLDAINSTIGVLINVGEELYTSFSVKID